MTARTLLPTTAIACTLALAAPAQADASTTYQPAPPQAQAAATQQAQASGLLKNLNEFLRGTVGALLDTTGQLVAQIDPTQGVLTDAIGQVIGTIDQLTGAVFDVTGQLLGTIDSATGAVLDPVGNVIGGIIPVLPSDPAGGSGGGSGGGNATTPSAQDAPAARPNGSSNLTMAFSASRTMRLSTLVNRGVRAGASCSSRCSVLAAVSVDRKTARKLGLTRGSSPVVIGSASGTPGTLAIRVSSRAARALTKALPSSRTRRSVRSKRIRAYRAYRSKKASKAARRKARRSYLRYRKTERSWIRSGRVKITVSAVGLDPSGKTTTLQRRSIIVKR